MTEIPGEFPLPEEAAQRQRSLLGAHIEAGRRSAANHAPGPSRCCCRDPRGRASRDAGASASAVASSI